MTESGCGDALAGVGEACAKCGEVPQRRFGDLVRCSECGDVTGYLERHASSVFANLPLSISAATARITELEALLSQMREALTAIWETSTPHTVAMLGDRVEWDGRTWKMDRATEAKVTAALQRPPSSYGTP